MSLKLVSINIERSMHLDLVGSFLAGSSADVVCVQELMEADAPVLAQAMGNVQCIYEPMGRRTGEGDVGIMGIGIFSKTPVLSSDAVYYVGGRGQMLDSDSDNAATFNSFNRMVLHADVEQGGVQYRIATTHFTWTPDGKPNDEQRSDMDALKRSLDTLGEFVLCGDFNAPRGGEMFAELSKDYRDNIPPQYVWSLDLSIHRAGNGSLQEHARQAGLEGFMVDGLFTTSRYEARDVALVGGVSDHMAVTADIQKAQ